MDFWKMLLTFGVWSSVSNVDNIKILEFTSDNENKFTFKSMLETDPEEWDQLEGYDDFVGEYVIFDAETNTLTLRNIRVTGKWVAYDEEAYRCINLNNNIKHIIMEDSVSLPGNCIPSCAFIECYSLESIRIPKTVTSIGGIVYGEDGEEADEWDYYGAFELCTSLTSVTIPGSVTTIENWAFRGCTSLTSVTIPGSVTTIGNHAFNGCMSLTSITIPGSVTTIGKDAFANCTSLTTMLIPSDCAINDNDGFDVMPKLTYVITTDKFIYDNYETIFKGSNSINISTTDNNTIYHIYTKSNGTVKYAVSDESTQLISTPANIAPYVTNSSSIDTTDTKVYQYTLKPDIDSGSDTFEIKITESKVYQSVVLLQTTDYDYYNYYNISSAPTTYTSSNIILDVSDFSIAYSDEVSYKATIITDNTPHEILSININSTTSGDNTIISKIIIPAPSFNQTINNYITISPS